MRVPFEQRNERPEHPRVIYPPVLNINHFDHFPNLLENHNPMDDEPMWAADRVIALTPSPAITIPENANEFAIKENHLTLIKGNQIDSRIKTDPNKQIHEFLGVCDMFKYEETENKAVHLIMFPLSLTGEAKTCINVIDEILEEDFDALLDEGSKILYSINGTPLKDIIFFEFDEFITMNIKDNTESKPDEEITFEKITFDTNYKIKKSLDKPPTDPELKPLPDHLEYTFLEEPSFLPVIISSQLSE
nr:reverse transcriptase domain-containing protein [Tanacetum cinerariifolium]